MATCWLGNKAVPHELKGTLVGTASLLRDALGLM